MELEQQAVSETATPAIPVSLEGPKPQQLHCLNCGKAMIWNGRGVVKKYHSAQCANAYRRRQKTENRREARIGAAVAEQPIPETIAAKSNINLSAEQLQELLVKSQSSGGLTMEMITHLVTELRKPDEETVRQREADKEKRAIRLERRLAEIRAEVEAREANQAACSHRNEKGRWLPTGQITSGNGMYKSVCLRCGKEWDRQPNADEISGGTGIGFGLGATA